MKIKIIKDENLWNKVVARQNFAQFLQSFEWGRFQQMLGRKIWHFFVGEEKDFFLALIIKHSLPFGFSYIYSPRGPIFSKKPTIKIMARFVSEIGGLIKKEKVIFWRFEPSYSLIFRHSDSLVAKVSDFQPSKTWILDLNKTETNLLKDMHYKTRYNIRLAARRGVKIRCANKKTINKDIKAFLSLLHQTAERDGFKPHSDSYYLTMVKELTGDSSLLRLYLAEYKDKILAANIVIFFGDTVTYLHGASNNELRNLMAPHLLQWRVIQEAKKFGYRYYDFWGINQKKWPGITRFKKSFGGREINYPGTYDFVFNKSIYKLYQLAKNIKSLRFFRI